MVIQVLLGRLRWFLKDPSPTSLCLIYGQSSLQPFPAYNRFQTIIRLVENNSYEMLSVSFNSIRKWLNSHETSCGWTIRMTFRKYNCSLYLGLLFLAFLYLIFLLLSARVLAQNLPDCLSLSMQKRLYKLDLTIQLKK